MKKVNITKIIGIILIAFIIILTVFTFTYVSDLRAKQLEEISQYPYFRTDFSFFVSECLQDTFDDSEFGIFSEKWVDNTYYEVKVRILLNCEDKIIGGSYSFDNETNIITCEYSVFDEIPEPSCVCVYELTYRFLPLARDFEVETEQITAS